MAQEDIFAADRAFTQRATTRRRDPRQDERERAETRYRNVTGDANPLAQPVILPGEPGYGGEGQFLPDAGVVVRGGGDLFAADRAATESLTPSMMQAEEIAQGRIQQSGASPLYQGLTLGFSDELAGGIAGLGQMASNAVRSATGQPIEVRSGDLARAVTDAQRAEQQRFSQANPVVDIALQGAGGLLTGGAFGVGGGVAGAARSGALAGGAYGGGTAEGNVLERLPGAALGAAGGALLGGATQAGLNAAQPYAQRLGSIVGGQFARAGNAMGLRPNLTERYGSAVGAADRLARNIGPEQIQRRGEMQALGLQPTVLDTLSPSGERLVRTAAGPAGPGADMAVTNLRSRTANLKPEIMADTRRLTGDPRTAQAYRQGLEETRDTLATTQYREPYAAPIDMTEEAIAALSDRTGQEILRRAMRSVERNPDFAGVRDEIAALMRATNIPGDMANNPTIRDAIMRDALGSVQPSGNALDVIRRTARDMGIGMARGERPDNIGAAGMTRRVGMIDTALDQAPGLTEARSTFRQYSQGLNALDDASAIFSTDPADFAARVQGMSQIEREAMAKGVEQQILDTLGRQRQAGTGAAQNIAEAPYITQNLETLLGPGVAREYIGRIQGRVGQLQAAARISPNTNSQTFGRGLDEETLGVANMVGAGLDAVQGVTGNPLAIARTIDRLAARATLSPQERADIVQLGLGSADDLERIVQVAEAARAARRPPPREVRQFLSTARNALGSQSPVFERLQQALLPALSPASGQEQ